MKSLLFNETLLHLDTITRVEFNGNDEAFVADDQCAVYFIGSGNDPWVVRGEGARPLFDRLVEAMKDTGSSS